MRFRFSSVLFKNDFALSLSSRVLLSFSLFVLFVASVFVVVTSVASKQPQSHTPPTLYSNQLRQDLRLTLVDAIRQAKQSIHMVMFGLSDPTILNALAHKKTATVIYYDAKGSPNLNHILPKATLHSVKGRGLMHQKILVLDEETVFIGSANMTTASLRMHDNLVIGLKNKQIAQFLIDKTPTLSGYLEALVGEQKVELWLLPDAGGTALNDVKNKIRSAKKSLKIALFTFTHTALIEEVINAHKRGLDVQVVIDMHSGLGASKQAIETLKTSGVAVSMSRGLQLLHHKFILIDDQMLLTGSANWTKAAFYRNSDCLIVLHHLNGEQRKGMNSLWKRIESEAQPFTSSPLCHKSRSSKKWF